MVTSDFRPKLEICLFLACAMKNVHYNRYYRNSSVIVDMAMGQIPRFTERISSLSTTVRMAHDGECAKLNHSIDGPGPRQQQRRT